MGAKKSNLLQRGKYSPTGWKRRELDKLYKGFGFIIKHGRKHDIAIHPEYPQLRGTLTRSSGELHRDYISHAVKMIEKLLEIEGEENE